MNIIRFVFLSFITTICLTPLAHAWDLEVGIRALMPRLGVGVQDYKDKDGNSATFKPNPETTATGQSYHLGLRIDSWQVDYDSAIFSFESSIEAGSVVASDTEIECTITESRLGVNYHIERELAGMYAGGGFNTVKEEVTSDDNTWTVETSRPYLKAGIDLIVNSVTLRYEQVFYSLGEHNIQVNSLGLILVF